MRRVWIFRGWLFLLSLPLLAIFLLWFPLASPDGYRCYCALKKPDRVVLITTDPEDQSTKAGSQYLGGYRILDSVVLEPDEAQELCQNLRSGFWSYQFGTSACFTPRHALTVKNGSSELSMLICFECSAISIPASGARFNHCAWAKPFAELLVKSHRLKHVEAPDYAGSQ